MEEQKMKYNIILRNGRYALLEMETQYVVACGFDEHSQKDHNGHKAITTHIGTQAKL